MNKETIKAAAWKRNDGIITIGKSHAEILLKCPYGTCKEGSISGFVTSINRFIDRHEAAKIAVDSGQISKDIEIRSLGLLSENIWSNSNYDHDDEKGYYLRENKDV